jgi:DNA-binding IclR family transcriptional regulator
MMATQRSGTVTKALRILDEFLDGSLEITLSQLAARTGVHKTTVLRLCASLEEVGFLEHQPGMAYRLGPKIWQLAQAYRRNFRLEDLVRPLIQTIRDETGESVSFYEVDGHERVCRFRENSRLTIRHHVDEGARFPLTAGVVGRVLMAFMGASGPEFVHIRENGCLVAQGREPHTTSAAVPVLDLQDRLSGALVVSGPSVRFGPAACKAALPKLQAAAASIARSLPLPLAGHQQSRGKSSPSPRSPAGHVAASSSPPLKRTTGSTRTRHRARTRSRQS